MKPALNWRDEMVESDDDMDDDMEWAEELREIGRVVTESFNGFRDGQTVGV